MIYDVMECVCKKRMGGEMILLHSDDVYTFVVSETSRSYFSV